MKDQPHHFDLSWITESNHGKIGIGNIKLIQKYDLQHNNIGAIISVLGQKDITLPSTIKHFRILIGDSPNQNIKCFFQSSYLFIQENIKHKNVVVHCQAGVSRSATIVIAYLMKKNKWILKQTLEYVKSKRPYIEPNKGFIKQLKSYQNDLIEQRSKSNCYIY